MFTDEQHIRLGAVLGFPSCCIAEWIEDTWQGIASGAERGSVTLRVRSDAEIDDLRPRLDAITHPGWTDSMKYDPRVCYVPCRSCVAAGHNA